MEFESYAHANIRKKEIADELGVLNADKKLMTRKIVSLTTELHEVNEVQKNLKKTILISDHAIVRYLERIAEIDMDEVREKILPKHRREHAIKQSNGRYKLENHDIRLKNGCVITVLFND